MRALFHLASLVPLALAAQPKAAVPVPAPLRKLPWGQLNVLHTTDVHGWLAGHLQEPSFSADWGDYYSFAQHLRQRADDEGVDLLLVDTGDRVEGNGLYDGSDPKGALYFDILTKQNIDLICSGNHELYLQNSSENEFYKTVPAYNDNYLASNLDIYNPKTGEREPLAPRFKKFTTKNQGIRILAFGFLFNFNGNANNTVVQPVQETVKEKWFQDAIRDKEIDLIIVYGHVALRTEEFGIIYKAIREVQWDRPIAFFGGHAHVRDYRVFDKKAAAIASGRYMETVGFMGISGLNGGAQKGNRTAENTASFKFERRYIDKNIYSLHAHSGKNASNFDTKEGKNITAMITSARKKLKLDHRRGCAPDTLWVNRASYPGKDSIFSWLTESVLPVGIAKSPRIHTEGKKALVFTNTGSIRFDVFKGAFTKDTEYLISPFINVFRAVPDVPLKVAARILELLNSEGPILADAARSHGLQSWTLAPPEQMSGRMMLQQQDEVEEEGIISPTLLQRDHPQAVLWPQRDNDQSIDDGKEKPSVFPGYTTIDDLGDDGDDTVHSRITFYEVPNAVQAVVGFSLSPSDGDPPEVVDVVYNKFIEPWIILALKYLGENREATDSILYLEGKSMTEVIREWVEENWKVEDGKDCP